MLNLVKREGKWLDLIKIENKKLPEAFVQPIAAGEKVVASTASVSYQYLRDYCSEAVAVDMEGNGFMLAARPYNAQTIEIRGISDLIDNKAAADEGGSQPRTAANAAAFCFEMINEIEDLNLQKTSTSSVNLDSSHFKKDLVAVLVNLYPQGPEQNSIWQRAGGDISILVNSENRKSQWFNAIEKLALGGGGKEISIESLISEIRDDFPTNKLIINLMKVK